MRHALVAALASALASLAVAAQAAPVVVPVQVQPSPEVLAEARAAGDTIIAKTSLGDVFENITTGPEPLIRHKGSGLVCIFGTDPAAWTIDDVVAFPSGLPRGDDVGCNTHFKGFTISMDVTRFVPTPELDAITGAYVKSVMKLHPNAKPYTGPAVDMQPPAGSNFPPYRTVRFSFDENGGLYSRLSVAVVRDWVIEERVTGPIADGRFGDLLAGIEMINAMDGVHGGDLLKKP